MMKQIVDVCVCTHVGEDHAAREPRVCKKISCNCYQYRARVPEVYSQFLTKFDKYKKDFETKYELMEWVCSNMPFLAGFTNSRLLFWWWKYVCPRWDPTEEFLDEDRQKLLMKDAKPEVIIRVFRLFKEIHPEFIQTWKNLNQWQDYMEEGIKEGVVEIKS